MALTTWKWRRVSGGEQQDTAGAHAVAFDRHQQPHLFHSIGVHSTRMIYCRPNGDTWQPQSVTYHGDAHNWSAVDLSIDSRGVPHFAAALALSPPRLIYGQIRGSVAHYWDILSHFEPQFCNLHLKDDHTAIVVFYAAECSLRKLHVAQISTDDNDGISVSIDPIATIGTGPHQHPSSAIDAQGGLHIAHFEPHYNSVRYLYRAPCGAWHAESLGAGEIGGQRPSLALTTKGTPVIAFDALRLPNQPQRACVATRRGPNTWALDHLPIAIEGPDVLSLALDAGDRPYILLEESGHTAIGLAARNPRAGGWLYEKICLSTHHGGLRGNLRFQNEKPVVSLTLRESEGSSHTGTVYFGVRDAPLSNWNANLAPGITP